MVRVTINGIGARLKVNWAPLDTVVACQPRLQTATIDLVSAALVNTVYAL